MTAGGGSAHVNPSTLASVSTPLQGIRARAGSGVNVSYAKGVPSPSGDIVDTSFLTPASGGGTGLTAQYFTNTACPEPRRSPVPDPNVNFLWGGQPPASGVPATGWSVRWTGRLTPPTTGTYQFSLNSDDGSRLFVNGQQVINNWFNQPPTTRTGSIALTAGQPVTIEVDYSRTAAAARSTSAGRSPTRTCRPGGGGGAGGPAGRGVRVQRRGRGRT